MKIALEASAFPTEDPDRVRQAMLNIFPDAAFEEMAPADAGVSRLAATSADHSTLARRISELRIRDAARSVLRRSVRGSCLEFHLNKQAALAGRVNLTDGGSVLGDIGVVIECDSPDAEIDRITGWES